MIREPEILRAIQDYEQMQIDAKRYRKLREAAHSKPGCRVVIGEAVVFEEKMDAAIDNMKDCRHVPDAR